LEAITLVCDICGKPSAETVTIKVGARNRLKDFCAAHLAELLQNTRTPKRGRPRTRAAGAAAAGRSGKATKSATRKRSSAAKATRKARGAKTAGRRPRKRQAATS
jgi:hypothetical protein